MRVIAGRFRGTRLRVADVEGLRPTGDRQRETLFNVIASECPDARVLDLFAGSGALGLEALSRGAAAVTFVDSSRRAAQVLRDNIAKCRAEESTEVLVADWQAAVRRFRHAGRRYDLVFVDPPWSAVDGGVCARVLFDSGVVGPDALLVVEHERRVDPEQVADEVVRVLRVGSTSLSLCRRSVPDR